MSFTCGTDFRRLAYRRFGLGAQDAGDDDDPLWDLRLNVLKAHSLPLPESVPVQGVEGVFLASGVLSESECDLFVLLAEQLGFTSGEDVVDVPIEVRDNDVCVLLASQPLVAELCRRLQHLVPRLGAQGAALCKPEFVNARFRLYRYRSFEGLEARSPQSFGPHYDGAQAPSGVVDGRLVEDVSKGTSRSQMSVLLYLSGGHSGGETIFYPSGVADEAPEDAVRVAPAKGAALCFWHGDHPLSPLHEGAALQGDAAAAKYVIRTDVVFCKEVAPTSNSEWSSSNTVLAMQRAVAVIISSSQQHLRLHRSRRPCRSPRAAMAKQLFILLAVAASVPWALSAATELRANPIRKVVTMLQDMQKKVTEEANKADELFEKFQCYCQTGGSDLTASIEAGEAKVGELGPGIEAAVSKKDQTENDLKSHQSDKSAAKTAMAEATAIRDKEKAAFDKELGESKTNYYAIAKAIDALEQGMGGSFLQSGAAGILRAFLSKSQADLDNDRQEVLSFLSGEQGSEYAPQSGEIVGILKQMKDEMYAGQKDMITAEEAAVKSYEDLMAAKKKEVGALTKAIEEKLGRVGRLGVEIASMKNDLEDSSEALSEDKAFLKDMKKNCASKAAVHEEEKKMRAQEVVALADTIKILNDDDALELFKKTLPSASASFLQLQTTASAMRSQAKLLLAKALSRARPGHGAQRLDFISLALSGRKIGFDKVIKMIDELVATLQEERDSDNKKKEYCAEQLDMTEDKQKDLESFASDIGTAIEETKEGIATLVEEIEALKAGIVALDKAVSEATEQRKAENAEYKELMASNGAAKELILFAKNRLNKFYDPKMYKEESPQQETAAPAFVQLAARRRSGDAAESVPAPPPETMAAYTKKSEGNAGVLQMMDLLVKDLDAEMTAAKSEEKSAQEEYEQTMADSAEKRATDSKSLGDKEASKAELQSVLETSIAEKKSTEKGLMAVGRYLQSMHVECDWLLQYYDVREQARVDEIDSLNKAKAVLSGADFALVQQGRSVVRTRKFLRHTRV